MNRIGMLIAMKEEAKPIIEGLDLQISSYNKGGFTVYEGKGIVLIVAGIGIVNATMGAQLLVLEFKCDLVLNFGTCGGTGKRFKTGDIVSVSRVFKRDVNLTIAGFKKYEIPGNGVEIDLEADENFGECDCYTSDEFVGIDSDVEKDIVVEMEAYPVAFVCKRYAVPCKIYKVVSDLTETNVDDSEHSKNLATASEAMAEYIIKLVRGILD